MAQRPIDIQFKAGESDAIRVQKLRALVEELVRLINANNGGGGSSGGAPDDAHYVLVGSDARLGGAYALTQGSGIDITVAGGQVTISVGTLSYGNLPDLPTKSLLGRYETTDGPPQSIGIGAGLELTDDGVLQADIDTSAGYPAQLGHAGI